MVTNETGTSGTAATWQWLRGAWGGDTAPEVLAIIGLGRGEVLDALAERQVPTKVLALEPDPGMALAIAAHPVWQAWRASGRLVYLAGPDYDGADQAWRIFPTRFATPAFAVNPGLVMTPAVAGAAEVLKKILIGAEENWKARQRFAPRYLTNSLRNLPAIVTGPSVSRLKQAFAGMPAIIVGAGPSLDRVHEDLRKAAGRAVIIATDTALRPLLVNGVVPDFVVGLDPAETNARHFFDLPACRHTWLVAESALDPRAAATFAGRTFWFRASDHQPWPWLGSLGAEDGHLDVWGSVLTAAFQVAALGGCDPVIALGADFSYVDGRPYARSTTLEFDWAWAASFGTSVEQTWQAQTRRPDVQFHPDVRGVDTPTTPVLLAFRDWMLAQARKGGRRIVNASGAGMLFGAGIEQAALADVLGGAIHAPLAETLARRTNDVRPTAVARTVRALSREVAGGRLGIAPLPDWAEFTGGTLNSVAVAAALDEAATILETKRGGPVAPTAIPWDLVPDAEAAAALGTLPEFTLRVRQALRGDAALVPNETTAGASSASGLLFRALQWLKHIVDRTQSGDDFVSWPDPALVGAVPASGIAMWPDTVRWSVTLFEALLGRAWGTTVPPQLPCPFGEGTVVPREAHGGESARRGRPRPFVLHARVMLVVEWWRAVASAGTAGRDTFEAVESRLAALERLMRTWPVPAHDGAQAELVIQAHLGDSTMSAVLPLGISEVTLARVASGAAFDTATNTWIWGQASAGEMDVVVGHRAEPQARRPVPAARPPARPAHAPGTAMPRRLTHAGWPAASVAGPVDNRVLAVTPFTNATSLIDADGRVERYQTWPRVITGALSLGSRGEIAWSNVWNLKTGTRPYLMYRPTAQADVEIIDLPFRPSAAVLWNGRVYWNGQPMPGTSGGVGSWAPGEAPELHLPDLTLFPLVPLADRLSLAPLNLDHGDAVLRKPSTHGWHWIPGQSPVPAMNGPHGQPTSVAERDGWSAAAHPHADLIRLTAPDGQERLLRCYYPLRLAWAGPSLVVMTGERELLLFGAIGSAPAD